MPLTDVCTDPTWTNTPAYTRQCSDVNGGAVLCEHIVKAAEVSSKYDINKRVELPACLVVQ